MARDLNPFTAVAALLCLVSGHSPAAAREHGDLRWHTATGLVMLTIASMSALSAFELLHYAMEAGSGFAVIGSVIAFVFVYCIDLFINMTPRQGDKLRHRLVFLLVRGPLGLVIACSIGLGTALHLNQDDINAYVAHAAASQSTADVNAYANTAPQTKAITADTTEINQLTSQNSGMETIASQKKADWWQDMVPCQADGSLTCAGDIPGWGLKSRVLYADYESYVSNTLDPTEKANDNEIAALRADIAHETASLKVSEAPIAAADGKDTGLAAQTRALLHIMSVNWVLWLLPIVILAWDQTIMLSKVLFPRRRTEIAEQELREDQSIARGETKELAAQLRGERASNQAWKDAREEAHRHAAATWLAEEKARLAKRTRTAKQATMAAPDGAATSGQTHRPRPAAQPPAPGLDRQRVRRHRALDRADAGPDERSCREARRPRVSGNAHRFRRPVHQAQRRGKADHPGRRHLRKCARHRYLRRRAYLDRDTPASAEVTFHTTGKIIGKPVLSLPVYGSLQQAALAGALHVAFRSTAPGGWTTYPATYDAQTHTMNATLMHFSTWRFWTWDWDSILADISQTVGQWEGRRATSVPDCAGGPSHPQLVRHQRRDRRQPGPRRAWLRRGPLRRHPRCRTGQQPPLRPDASLWRSSSELGWHASPSSLADGLRNGIGDIAAQATNSLYLPPLSSASVGILDPENGVNRTFAITPTPATILADAVAMALGTVINNTASAASAKWGMTCSPTPHPALAQNS